MNKEVLQEAALKIHLIAAGGGGGGWSQGPASVSTSQAGCSEAPSHSRRGEPSQSGPVVGGKPWPKARP